MNLSRLSPKPCRIRVQRTSRSSYRHKIPYFALSSRKFRNVSDRDNHPTSISPTLSRNNSASPISPPHRQAPRIFSPQGMITSALQCSLVPLLSQPTTTSGGPFSLHVPRSQLSHHTVCTLLLWRDIYPRRPHKSTRTFSLRTDLPSSSID